MEPQPKNLPKEQSVPANKKMPSAKKPIGKGRNICRTPWGKNRTDADFVKYMENKKRIDKDLALARKGMEIGLQATCEEVRALIKTKNAHEAICISSPYVREIEMIKTLVAGALLLACEDEGTKAVEILESLNFRKNHTRTNSENDRLYLHAASGVHEWLLIYKQNKAIERLEWLVPKWLKNILVAQRLIENLDGQRPIDREQFFTVIEKEIFDPSILQDTRYAGAMIYQWQVDKPQKAEEISQKIHEPFIREFAERYLAGHNDG